MRTLVLLAACVVAGQGCATRQDTVAGQANPLPAQAPDTSRVATGNYESPHGSRAYRLFIPAATPGIAAAAAPAPGGRPLVVLLHGCAQDAAALAQAGRFDSLASELGALILYPEQPATANPLRCWNWFAPAHQGRDGGEPAIIAGLTRSVAERYGADPARISIGGLSAGGAMAVLTALAYPDLFAAVGSHSGVGWRVAADVPGAYAAMRGAGVDAAAQARAAHEAMGSAARMIPLIAFTGTADTLAVTAATDGLVRQFTALHAAVTGGATLEADTLHAEYGGYPVELRRYSSGRTPVVEEWVIDGLAHALSGGDPAARWTDPRGPDAAREMLTFLLRQRMGGGATEETQ